MRTTVALDDTDRRRFLAAAIVTMIALPALWWVNRDEGSAAPKVATAGVEVSSNGAPTPSVRQKTDDVETTLGSSHLPPTATVGDQVPVFFDGPVGNVGGISEIAVPATSASDSIITEATFRSSVPGVETCLVKNVAAGSTITIVNLDNDRETTCRAVVAPATQQDDLVMHTNRFTDLADLTDAPIPVEIRL